MTNIELKFYELACSFFKNHNGEKSQRKTANFEFNGKKVVIFKDAVIAVKEHTDESTVIVTSNDYNIVVDCTFDEVVTKLS